MTIYQSVVILIVTVLLFIVIISFADYGNGNMVNNSDSEYKKIKRLAFNEIKSAKDYKHLLLAKKYIDALVYHVREHNQSQEKFKDISDLYALFYKRRSELAPKAVNQ
jgi:hypothetical protein